jgi:hypothetical protein
MPDFATGCTVACMITERCDTYGQCITGTEGEKCEECAGNYYPVHETCSECPGVFHGLFLFLAAVFYGVSFWFMWSLANVNVLSESVGTRAATSGGLGGAARPPFGLAIV